jgi:uncharacterized protein with GYD domain
MATYVILSKLSPDAVRDPADFPHLAETVEAEIRRQCPDVHWKASYGTFGRYDVVDIVESDDVGQVERAALIIRSYGHASTETMLAEPWPEFVNKTKGRALTGAGAQAERPLLDFQV